MTISNEDPRPLVHAPGAQPPVGKRRVAAAVHEVCPYLRSEAGSWRSAYAAREHRCGAVQPAAQVTVSKQRSMCLVPAHEQCATFVAAGSLAVELMPSSRPGDGAALWPPTRSMPLLLEPTRGLPARFAGGSTKAGGQALLVGLMVLAFLVLVIARTTAPPGTASPAPAASQSAAAAVVPSPSGAPSPSPTATVTAPPSPVGSPSAPPSATPSATPSRTPRPSGSVTYTVLANDTLSGIAAKFHTTVKAIATANNITNPRLIHAGQVLVIP